MKTIAARFARLGAWCLIAIAMGWPVFARAQEVTLDIQPRTLRLNESATLRLTFINLNPPQSPALPPLEGFDIQYVGQEKQYQIINGRQEQRLTFNYRLQPLATGQFRLGPFAMQVGGNKIDFDEVVMDVLPASANTSDGQQETMADLVFAKLLLPRREVFLQERFDVELALYYRGVQLDRSIQLQNMPNTGLNLEDFQELGSTREAIDNEVYEVRRFRMRGTAISSGDIDLAPMVRVNVLVRRERSRDPFFGGFDAFFGLHEAQPLIVPAEPVKVTIRPLPAEGRPANFGGAVGQFSMDLDVQPRDVQAGDPVTLTLRITGKGNFETISMPSIDLGQEFRRYDPKLIASGRDHKVFEQVFIPRSDAITELPAVSFAYFDPESASYQSITRGPLALTVSPGSSNAPHMVQAPVAGAASTERETLGIDIIGLKRAIARWEPPSPPSAPSPSAIALHTTPLLALLALMVWQKRRDNLNRDIGMRRRSLAPKSARAALKRAEQAKRDQRIEPFYAALWQALADYIAHRANLQPGEVTPDLLLARAQRGGMAASDLAELRALLETCEAARFGGRPAAPGDLDRHMEKTQEILRTFERCAM